MCHKYRISFNPNEIIFAVTEGKFLGYLISKKGIVINPKRNESIIVIAFLNKKKDMQSFLVKIIFVSIFIFVFVEIVKPLQGIIKKDVIFK